MFAIRDKVGGSGVSPRDSRDRQTAVHSAQCSSSPPLGLPDGTWSWRASRPSPSGRSAVWRRAARPCTLGRPGVQVAKGSPVPVNGGEGVRVRVCRWLVARQARSNESRAADAGPRPPGLFLFSPFFLPFRSYRERDKSRPPSSHSR